MELRSLRKSFPQEEKHQMLNLNRRLETYLGRVKLLEEENALLAREIRGLRGSGASGRRQVLEEELRRARLEVDSAWRDRVHAEMEAGRVAEELRDLEQQTQREAQARAEAKRKLEQSRKELEEEQRAQIRLRDQVGQLENEVRHLMRTHRQDVAHLEASVTRSRAAVAPTSAQRGCQVPDLQQLGQEYSQRAARAWQEAAEAHQGHLDRLEESLHRARGRLAQVGQEKSDSQLKLRALQKEMESAQDVRLHLETAAAQQGGRYSQEIQQLQEHLDGLEDEKEELGRQMDRLVLENQVLLQQKTSLGLEVATYRALLDSEGLRGDVPLSNQPRNISTTDAVFSPRGVKTNHQTQLSAGHRTTSLSSVRGLTGRRPAAMTASPIWSRNPVTLADAPKISSNPDTTKSATCETQYPKILQDGAVESFRPQEVREEVTHAEPLSPPNEQEAETTSGDHEGQEDRNHAGVDPTPDRPVLQSVVSYQVESGFSTEPPVSDEISQHQFTTPHLTPYCVSMTEEPCGFSDESDMDVPFEESVGKEDMQELHAAIDAWPDKEFKGKEIERVQEETAEAGIEPNFEFRTSHPVSECQPEESSFDKGTDFSPDENILKEDAAETRQEMSCSVVGTNETDVEDKLYPDGEEMDTWDSVIERKVDLKTEEGIKKDEDKGQHAEPEEDISAREQKHEKRESCSDLATEDNKASSVTDTHVDDDGRRAALDQEHTLSPGSEEDDDEEDSQNVSVSWRTELEGDSYAQDNTLADTRPLIRYKSDEADANTQASHVDESDSSDGEQEKKFGETGMWSEGKSKKFGTMEDLCEEVEGEALDEEYNLGYTHIENRAVGRGQTGSELATLGNAEGMIRKLSEGQSDGETEELTKPTTPTNMFNDEELETDRLVEQELENLATDSYSAHFAQRLLSGSEGKSVEEKPEREEAGMLCLEEPDAMVTQPLSSSTPITDRPYENLHFWDSSVAEPQADTQAYEEVQHEDQEATDAPERREEEEEHNASMLTHANVTEDPSRLADFISRPGMEEINNSQDPNSVLPVSVDQESLQAVAAPVEVKEEALSASQGHLLEDVADRKEFPEAPETAEWEVLENPSEDFEFGDQSEDYEKCANVPESAEAYRHDDDDGGSDEGVTTRKEATQEISPGSAPDGNDIFGVKDSADLANTNGKDSSLHGFFTSGITDDIWETGAANQPEEGRNEAAEPTNHNLVWGNSDNVVNVVNARVEIDSSKALNAQKEQEQVRPEGKQVVRRDVVEGEFVGSDESDVEGESWSSGEEPV